MKKIFSPIHSTFNAMLSWLGTSLNQSTASYCELQTADSDTVLVNNDGTLVTVLKIDGVRSLIGVPEFENIQRGLEQCLQTTMSQSGYSIQVLFNYNKRVALNTRRGMLLHGL